MREIIRRAFFTARVCAGIGLGMVAGLSCTGVTDVAGTGSQSGNARVFASVYRPSGAPATDATLVLRPAHARADTSGQENPANQLTVQLNSRGQAQIDSIGTGAFSLEIIDGDSLKGLFFGEALYRDTVLQFDSLLLQRPSQVSGAVDPSVFNHAQSAYALIEGTGYVAIVDTAGKFVFPSVPRAQQLTISIVSFALDTVARAPYPARVDSSIVHLPETLIVSPDYIADTLTVRALLDANRLSGIRATDIITLQGDRVIKLNAQGLGLQELSNDIGNLAALAELNLSHNLLTTLPDSLVKCGDLKKLWLGYNEFEQFPAVLWQCTTLTWLEIGHNFISDSIPDAFNNLTALDTVYFSYNRIPSLSPAIGELTNLLSVNLDYNNLVTLPDSIVGCSRLQRLIVNNNQLQRLPDSLHLCSALRDLTVSHNRIDSLPPSLIRLDSLHDLRIEFNAIENFPFTVEQLDSMSTLRIANNRICTVADSVAAWLTANGAIPWPGNQECN